MGWLAYYLPLRELLKIWRRYHAISRTILATYFICSLRTGQFAILLRYRSIAGNNGITTAVICHYPRRLVNVLQQLAKTTASLVNKFRFCNAAKRQ